jgi:SAM-dependent methyltransferase
MDNLSNIFRKVIHFAIPAAQSKASAKLVGPEEARLPDDFSFDGFDKGRVHTKYVETLSDEDLRSLNALLPWKCFTVDSKGRRFGNRAWPGKREVPQEVPDVRITRLNERFGLHGKHVLELGCFEGVHTAALCAYGARVTAIDSRIENVVKTIVRCAMFGYTPAVFTCDLEQSEDYERLTSADILHHVGVLYHLTDPVSHLLTLCPLVETGIMLDTHFADEGDVNGEYEVVGKTYRYKRHREGGKAEVFSGMRDHAKWLTLDDLAALLTVLGFGEIDIVNKQLMRNGPRALIYARRIRKSEEH